MCADCLKAQAAERNRIARERQEADERTREEAAHELSERRRNADHELAQLSEPDEIVRVLEECSELLSRDACAAAWLQLMEHDSIGPSHEIATVYGRGHFLILGWQEDPGWNWYERGKREDAWLATESGTYLDRGGREWQLGPALLLGSDNPFVSGEKNWVALPRGARFRTRIGLHYWGLVLLHNAPTRAPVEGHAVGRVELSGYRYACAMAEILREQIRAS
jgi:hypothetical protein